MTPEAWKDRLLDTCLWELVGEETPPDLSRGILEAARRSESEPRRALRPVWAAVAAAAAVIVGAAILYTLRREPAPPAALTGTGFIVAAKTGEVGLGPGRLTTEKESSCRLDFDEGFTVAAGPNTTLTWARDDVAGTILLRHEQGHSYVHTKKRGIPLAIRVGNAAIEILGTRLLIRGEADAATVGVLDGEIRYAREATAILVEQDRGVRPVVNSPGGDVSVEAGPLVVAPAAVSWLDRLGIASAELRRDGEARTTAGVDFSRLAVFAGDWEIRTDGNRRFVLQRSASGHSKIMFGGTSWEKGAFSFRFRLTEIGPGQPGVGFLLFNKDRSSHLFALGRALQEGGICKRGEWLCSHAEFEIGPDALPVVTKLKMWMENAPQRVVVMQRPWVIPGSRARFDACGVGLVTDNCAVEFRDLKIE
jgi:hypothetical protein